MNKNYEVTAYGFIDNSFGPIDEFGKSIKRTKFTHPYSYDGFVTYRNGKNKDANGTVYTDRLRQWDSNKNSSLSKKHFGNDSDYWEARSPVKVQDFLREYMDDKDLKLILIMEYCNQSNGYPVWRFDYHTTKI